MTRSQALILATKILQRRAQELAFNANLHDLIGSDIPSAVNASKERKKILAAIEVLKGIALEAYHDKR